MDQKTVLFSNKRLSAMIIPLFLEQLLVMLVGLADTLIVSYAGEAVVSGVSLVNQFNTIFIYLFTALASGGAVVISQSTLQMGVIGIAAAMVCDWIVRAAIFIWRQRSGKWKAFHVI